MHAIRFYKISLISVKYLDGLVKEEPLGKQMIVNQTCQICHTFDLKARGPQNNSIITA